MKSISNDQFPKNIECPKRRILTLCPLIVFAMMTLSSCQPMKTVVIRTQTDPISIAVEVARTPDEKATGLMYRKSLPEGQGMLFVYDKPLIPPFWMKNTLIPLDILFIGSDLRIKTIAENTPPCPSATVCLSYAPSELVQYVLELNGGIASRRKITIGDTVNLSSALD